MRNISKEVKYRNVYIYSLHRVAVRVMVRENTASTQKKMSLENTRVSQRWLTHNKIQEWVNVD